VPTSNAEDSDCHVNPYIDWDQYTSIFDPDFLEKDLATAKKLWKGIA
jgi:hypothetical protein